MLVYKITSPNMPNTVYVGSTVRTEEERWGEHTGKSNSCSSKHIVAVGDAKMDVIETVTDPSVNLVDREYFYIMKFKHEGFTVLNKYMPGAIARAGGVKAYEAAYGKQYRADNPEKKKASNAIHNAKKLLPLKCENCGCMSSKTHMKTHH